MSSPLNLSLILYVYKEGTVVEIIIDVELSTEINILYKVP